MPIPQRIFVQQQGRFTFAEAFYLNHQMLLARIQRELPKKAHVSFDRWNGHRDPQLPAKLARKHGLTSRDAIGLLWDRDTVAFYGDPAWEARMAPRPLAWEQKLTAKDGLYTFTLTASRDTGRPRPPVVLLPHRVKDVRIIAGADLEPVVTDNFLLLPKPTKFEKGKTYKVIFKAARVQ